MLVSTITIVTMAFPQQRHFVTLARRTDKHNPSAGLELNIRMQRLSMPSRQ